MTANQITKKQAEANVKFEVARQIRELLDAAKKSYGATNWDDEDMENEILSLVCDD